MTYKVYGYVANGGDGSYSLCWFEDEADEDRLLKVPYADETWFDGDGLNCACKLTFDSREAALAAGIPKDTGPWEYGNEDEEE